MTATKDPVVLELAPLPREQLGPFIILGIDKDATAEEIEAAWAKRVIQGARTRFVSLWKTSTGHEMSSTIRTGASRPMPPA